jgi:hypothetical protein
MWRPLCPSRIFRAIERQLRRAWHLEPSASLAAWATRTLSPVLSQYCFARTRVAFLRSYTIEPAVQLLTSQALCERLGLDAWIGNFNTYSQEILQPWTVSCTVLNPTLLFWQC